MIVSETFFSVEVGDMQRATAFYVAALGAEVMFATSIWSSLRIAGVRIGLFHHAEQTGGRVGLHFAVSDLAAACADVERAGGSVVMPAREVGPGIVIAEVTDTERNAFTLRAA
jgi:predicted enzyme related to lactoylglutathione lyase